MHCIEVVMLASIRVSKNALVGSRFMLQRTALFTLNSRRTPTLIRKYASASKETSTQSQLRSTGSKITPEKPVSDTERLERGLARFWEKVSCEETPNVYKIMIDGKTIKTPLGFKLEIPKEKQSLAYLLTNEWKLLPSLHVRPYLLTLTSLSCRAIDLAKSSGDEDAKAKIGDPETIKTLLLKYLDTDTLLVFSPVKDCEGELRKEQQRLYYPLKKEMEEFFTQYSKDGQNIVLKELDTEVSGLVGNKQSEETRNAVKEFLDSLDTWELVALERTTLTCKSLLCGVAVVRKNRPDDQFDYSLDDLARAATLETVMQTKRWGEVEDTHDVEKVDVRRVLSASSLLCFRKPNDA